MLDCGTGLEAPPARAALGCADQLVLVTDAQPDTASLVWEAARRLEHDAPPLVLLVNKVDRSSRLDVAALWSERISVCSRPRRGAERSGRCQAAAREPLHVA